MPATTTDPTPGTTRAARRFDGVDVARGLAIVGMLPRHVGPRPQDPDVASAAWLYSRTDGRAAVLFVVVAGVGVALLASRRPWRWTAGRLVYRAVWLLPLGLWLQTLDHPVAVILHFYALFFVAVLPFVRARDGTVLGAAAVLTIIGPALVLLARQLRPGWVTASGGEAPNLAVELLVTGTYPVVTYLPPMLVGLWVGRRLLAWSRAGRWPPTAPLVTLAAVGTAALVLTVGVSLALEGATGLAPDPDGWSWALTIDGHSEMPLALLGATGLAVAVLATCVLVADRLPRLLWPATAFGRLALTVYVGHLLAFDLLPAGTLEGAEVADGLRAVAAVAAVGVVVAVAWLRLRPAGPLEELERWPYARWIAPRIARRGPGTDDAGTFLHRGM